VPQQRVLLDEVLHLFAEPGYFDGKLHVDEHEEDDGADEEGCGGQTGADDMRESLQPVIAC
jgi:hypothetical protein